MWMCKCNMCGQMWKSVTEPTECPTCGRTNIEAREE